MIGLVLASATVWNHGGIPRDPSPHPRFGGSLCGPDSHVHRSRGVRKPWKLCIKAHAARRRGMVARVVVGCGHSRRGSRTLWILRRAEPDTLLRPVPLR